MELSRISIGSAVLFSFFLLSSLLIPLVFGSSLMWSQTYGGPDQEIAHWLVETSDGGYAIGGYTRDFGAPEGDDDFLLVKIDANGKMEWNQTYEMTEIDRVRSMIITSDGGYVIVGGHWLVKVDLNGNMEWNQTFGGTDAHSVVEIPDGGYVIAGRTGYSDEYKDDFLLIKTDSHGNLEWNRTYGGTGSDNANSVIVTFDGGFALAGSTWSFNSSSPDFWLIKTDANGNMVWNQTYDYDKWWESANFVFETAGGGYVIAGVAAFPPPLPVYYFWVIKTDAYGNMEWNKTYGESEYEQANSVVLTSDGGFAISGSKQFFDHGYHHDFWLIKTDANGNEEWSQTYGGTDNEIPHSLIETSDGGYALAGESYPKFWAGDSDFWIVKTDEQGIIPEFSSWIMLPLLLVSALVVVGIRNKIKRNG